MKTESRYTDLLTVIVGSEHQLSRLFAACIFGTICIFLLKALIQAHDSHLSKIPGPLLSRYTNLPLKWHVIIGKRTTYIHQLHELYGPVVRIAPHEVGFSGLDAFQEIHKSGTQFTKSKWYQQLAPDINSEETSGFFNMQNQKNHGIRRKLFSHAFSQAAALQLEDPIAAKVQLAVQKIKRDALAGRADLVKWWRIMAADVISELAFGESFDTLKTEKKTGVVQDIETSMMVGGLNSELPILWRMLTVLSPLSRKIDDLTQVFDRLKIAGTKAAVNTRLALEQNNSGKTNVFSRAFSEDKRGMLLPDNIIGLEAMNFMVAGGDTTASTLTYLVWAVLSHPDVKKRLLKEIEDAGLKNARFEDLRRLKYLNNVVEETLRMYPAAPGSLPRVSFEDALLGGYRIPKGTVVVTQAWTFHRDAETFPEPLKFEPSRWENATVEMQRAFVPWGGGARVCMGQNFARMQLLFGAYFFFRECADARVLTRPEMMEPEDYFLLNPVGHECCISIP